MVRDNVFMIIDKKGTGIGQMFHHNNKCKTHTCGIPYKINLYISVVYIWDNVFMIIDKKGTGIGQMFHHNNKCKTHTCGIPYKINLYISVVYI